MLYLASPYSAPVAEIRRDNFRKTTEAVADLIKRGYYVVSPIVHCHYIAETFDLPTDFRFWQNYNEALMRKADSLYVLTISNYKVSVGVKAEVTFALNTGLPVFLYDMYSKQTERIKQLWDTDGAQVW